MTLETLRDLYVEQLQDIHNAEEQLIEALPKMADNASHEELQNALKKHLQETKTQRERLQQIFDRLGAESGDHTCKGMAGLITEGEEFLEEKVEENVRDAALIASAQRIEHYEIAAYGTARAYAEMLDRQEEHQILSDTLQEEKHADSTLNEIAIKVVNPEAAGVR